MFLIDNIILAPLKGTVWLSKKIAETAENQLSDRGRVKEELMRLQLQFELDEITEEEYCRRESELLQRLDTITKANNGR